MPTLDERRGDFSASPIALIDPATGQPFSGNVIPEDRISDQARSLLRYYPVANLPRVDGYNFQAPIVTETNQDNLQTRITQRADRPGSAVGLGLVPADLHPQPRTYSASSIRRGRATWTSRRTGRTGFRRSSRCAFATSTRGSRTTSFRISPAARTSRARRASPATTNSRRTGDRRRSSFSSGIAGLGHPQFIASDDATHGGGADVAWSRGRHYVTFGGGRGSATSTRSASRTRAASSRFTGSTTGSDFADFLLGIPHSSSHRVRQRRQAAARIGVESYINDDWRVSPALTLNLGVRWEYESPLTEEFGRLANLDIASGFHGGRASAGERSGRHAHRHAVPVVAGACRLARRSAAARPRMAAGGGFVARRPRPVTVSIATPTSTSRSRWQWRSSRRSRRRSMSRTRQRPR